MSYVDDEIKSKLGWLNTVICIGIMVFFFSMIGLIGELSKMNELKELEIEILLTEKTGENIDIEFNKNKIIRYENN